MAAETPQQIAQEPTKTYTLRRGARFWPPSAVVGEPRQVKTGGDKVELTLRQAIAFRDQLVESPIVDARGNALPATDDGGSPEDTGGGWQTQQPDGASTPQAAQTGPHPIHDLNATEAAGLVEAQPTLGDLDLLQTAEARNPKHPGGRVSVNRAIETRRAALKAQ